MVAEEATRPPQPQAAEPDALGLAQADLTERVAVAMQSASRAYVAALLQALEAQGFDGLTPASVALLAWLPEEGAQTADLGRRTRRTKQATGRLVAELEARGYAERAADPDDRRASLVRPTARARAALAVGARVKGDLGAKAAAALGPEALARLYHDLERLEAVLDER